jgi:putative ABC transport system permease protein
MMDRVFGLWEGVRVAGSAIGANLVRSILTVLGVAVGVAVVVVIAALISGIRSSIAQGFEAAGPDNFIVTRFDFTAVTLGDDGPPPWEGTPEVKPEEAARIAAVPGVHEALFNFGFSVSVDHDGTTVSGIQAWGYSSGWPAYNQGDFLAGRDFTPAEVRQARAVAVISDDLAGEVFGLRDPVGRRIGVAGSWRNVREEFTVIGVFDPEENIFDDAVSHWLIVPHTAATKRLRASDWQAQVLVVPEDSVTVAGVRDRVTGLLRGMRGLGPRDENDFALIASAQLMELFDRFTGVFFLVMLALSSAGLMVGGVGVIGIMLISVTERTREIGIRKAVGATRREILWQFLVEASILTLLGGALGMAVGAATAEIVEATTPIPAAIPLWAAGAALAMAAVTGLLFGLLPAYRAARLEPVDALRYE